MNTYVVKLRDQPGAQGLLKIEADLFGQTDDFVIFRLGEEIIATVGLRDVIWVQKESKSDED